MNEDQLTDECKIPDIIFRLMNRGLFITLLPGETGWTYSHAVDVFADQTLRLKDLSVYRSPGPGGTANIKVIRDTDGFYLDATALEVDSLRFMYNEDDEYAEILDFHIPIQGVLWPIITENFGCKSEEIADHNRQQLESNRKFATYFEEKFGLPYVFAFQEFWTSYEAGSRSS